MMTECMNCCAEVTRATEFMYCDHLNPDNPSLTPAPQALNYIYKVSGKRIQIQSGGTVDGQLGLCQPCWKIVSQLFLLHKELTALTKLNSLVNKTFQVLEQTKSHSNPRVTKIVSLDSGSEDLPLQPEYLCDSDTLDEAITILDSPASSPAPAAAVNDTNKGRAKKCIRTNDPESSTLKKRVINPNSSPIKKLSQTSPLVNIRNSQGIRIVQNNVTHPKPSPKLKLKRFRLRLTPKALTLTANPTLSQPMSTLQLKATSILQPKPKPMVTEATRLDTDSISPISVTKSQNCVATCASQFYKTQKRLLVTPDKSKSVSSLNYSALFSPRIPTGLLPNATGSYNTGCGPASGNRRKQQLEVRTAADANSDQEHVSAEANPNQTNVSAEANPDQTNVSTQANPDQTPVSTELKSSTPKPAATNFPSLSSVLESISKTYVIGAFA